MLKKYAPFGVGLIIISFTCISFCQFAAVSWPIANLFAAPDFPSMEQILEGERDTLFFGPFFLGIGTVLLIILPNPLRASDVPMHVTKTYFFAIFAVIFGVGFTFLTYSSIVGVLLYRFDPDKVIEIRVEHLEENNQCSQQEPLIIQNKATIKEGFKWLRQAERLYLSHEGATPEEGYRIEIKYAEAVRHYSYISIFKKSSSNRIIYAVVPHIEAKYSGSGRLYTSPEFYDWLTNDIEPMFTNCN